VTELLEAGIRVPAASTGRAHPTVLVVASHAPSLWNFRTELLQALVQRGYEVVGCAPADSTASARLAPLGVGFVALGPQRTSLNPFGDFAYFWRLSGLFRRLRPAAIITYTAKPVIWGSLAARGAGVPRIVAMITGLGFAFTETSSRSKLARLVEFLYRLALRGCHAVIFQNPDDQEEFKRRRLVAPRSESFVVNGSGVDLERFVPAPLPEAPVFLLIARVLRDKGIVEFCQAARSLRERYPAARFRIVGSFDHNPSAISPPQLSQLCGDGVVEYRGAKEDVRPEIAAARIYVLPSYREGTPRTILEAMAMGRPVITTDVPGCRETVQEGSNGFLVSARDAGELATAMERFLVTPGLAVEMGERGRALAVAKYDARKVANAVVVGARL
jgi:glycosyltransferase involved in cell wall biosynthesis